MLVLQVFLQLLKKNKDITTNQITLSLCLTLSFSMKKNAVGLATIAILSTMVLVTMSAATSIYNGSENIKYYVSHDFDVKGNNIEVEDLETFDSVCK